jgi:hypothetical protein
MGLSRSRKLGDHSNLSRIAITLVAVVDHGGVGGLNERGGGHGGRHGHLPGGQLEKEKNRQISTNH